MLRLAGVQSVLLYSNLLCLASINTDLTQFSKLLCSLPVYSRKVPGELPFNSVLTGRTPVLYTTYMLVKKLHDTMTKLTHWCEATAYAPPAATPPNTRLS